MKNELNIIKIKKTFVEKKKPICASKYTIKKKTTHGLVKIFANHIYDKGLIPKIYKELLQGNNKKINIPNI